MHCDGNKPCGRCIDNPCDQECSYQPHSKHGKTELVESLKSHDSWKRNAERVFQAIEANENTSVIIERIQNHESVESIAQWLQAANSNSEGPSPISSSRCIIVGSDNEMDDCASPGFRWSSVTANENIVQHLLTLYFTWIHPVYMLFDEQLFVHSYQQRSEVFCSSLLVNAICAMACYYHTAMDTDTTDFDLLGRDFSDAVRHELDHEDESLLSVQTFAVMFLVGCAQGKGLHASKYLLVANSLIASLEYIKDDSYQRVWRITARGVNCLNINYNLDDEERDMQIDKIR
ncbi:hypothetical protein CJF31_00011354 [Rutstroemia sp. NJR-2017a BVV2]|nr:hypothetical protein CJF31_00011354 [Rutstroemia sp. NJR-2017a BVV2]